MQVHQVQDEALRILAEVGYEIRGRALRARLLERGLKTGPDGRILFPPAVVERAVASTPREFTLYDRAGQAYTSLGAGRVHFTPGSSALNVLDHRSGQVRPANTGDFVEYIRLCDGLEHIAYPSTAFSTGDVEAHVADAWRLYLALSQSSKPVVSGAFTEHGVRRMAAMMQLFRRDAADLRDRPMAIFTITATGNFRYGEDSCRNLLDCVEAGIPVEVVPVTTMGLVAPVGLLEAAAFHTADVLAGLAMAQTVRPGAPVLFGGAPAAFHMQASTSPMSAVEALRLDLAYLAVAQSLGLPTQAYMGFGDGKSLDAQAGAETFAGALLAAAAGVDSVSGPGMLDFLMVFSLEKLVFDNELCGQALHFTRPVSRDPEADAVVLARELLGEGHLLTSRHTLENWQQALHIPGMVVDRLNRDTWERAGRWDLPRRAKDEVERRLASYEAVETDPKIVAEMGKLILADMKEQRTLPAVPPPPKRRPRNEGKGKRTRKYRR